MTDKKNVEYATIAPPKRSICQSFGLFLWNGETKELLGRSASSWGKSILSDLLLSSIRLCKLIYIALWKWFQCGLMHLEATTRNN